MMGLMRKLGSRRGPPIEDGAFDLPFHPHETHMETKVLDRGAYRYVLQVSIRTPIEDSGFDVRFMRVKWGPETLDCDRGGR